MTDLERSVAARDLARDLQRAIERADTQADVLRMHLADAAERAELLRAYLERTDEARRLFEVIQ